MWSDCAVEVVGAGVVNLGDDEVVRDWDVATGGGGEDGDDGVAFDVGGEEAGLRGGEDVVCCCCCRRSLSGFCG